MLSRNGKQWTAQLQTLQNKSRPEATGAGFTDLWYRIQLPELPGEKPDVPCRNQPPEGADHRRVSHATSLPRNADQSGHPLVNNQTAAGTGTAVGPMLSRSPVSTPDTYTLPGCAVPLPCHDPVKGGAACNRDVAGNMLHTVRTSTYCRDRCRNSRRRSCPCRCRSAHHRA